MGKYIWMAVEPDEYELPIAVADSARELADIFGIKKHSVECNAWCGYDGSVTGRKFVKVRNDDD